MRFVKAGYVTQRHSGSSCWSWNISPDMSLADTLFIHLMLVLNDSSERHVHYDVCFLIEVKIFLPFKKK